MVSWAYEPSSAGICQECGKHAEKRYGGMGRYPVVCLDCWLAGEQEDDSEETA